MSTPNTYWGSGAHMSADLKRTAHRVRMARPGMFAARPVKHTEMDGDGKVTTTSVVESGATPLSPRFRHAFSVGR